MAEFKKCDVKKEVRLGKTLHDCCAFLTESLWLLTFFLFIDPRHSRTLTISAFSDPYQPSQLWFYSQWSIVLSGCSMLQAMYEFRATLAKTLSFQEKEMFVLFPANKKQKQWWQVVNRKAQVGFIPSNYVSTIQVSQKWSICNFLSRLWTPFTA